MRYEGSFVDVLIMVLRNGCSIQFCNVSKKVLKMTFVQSRVELVGNNTSQRDFLTGGSRQLITPFSGNPTQIVQVLHGCFYAKRRLVS